jgi:hypothetical protein
MKMIQKVIKEITEEFVKKGYLYNIIPEGVPMKIEQHENDSTIHVLVMAPGAVKYIQFNTALQQKEDPHVPDEAILEIGIQPEMVFKSKVEPGVIVVVESVDVFGHERKISFLIFEPVHSNLPTSSIPSKMTESRFVQTFKYLPDYRLKFTKDVNTTPGTEEAPGPE